MLFVIFLKEVSCLMKFHTNFSQIISTKCRKFDLELKCYLSYFSRRYFWMKFHTNFSSKISTKLRKFDLELKCYVSYFSGIKEVSFGWNFILVISGQNKHRNWENWDLELKWLCVIFLKEVSSWMKFHIQFQPKIS